MKVIIDTSVWSLALRRQNPSDALEVKILGELIEQGRVQLLGPVRQEVLSGIKQKEQFERLKGLLAAFPDLILDHSDYEMAAQFCNECRGKGIQASNTDFLIAAAAIRRKFSILTTDHDFAHMATLVPLQIHR